MERELSLYLNKDVIETYNRLMAVKHLDYGSNDIARYSTVASWTIDAQDGYEIDLKVCSSNDGSPLWCEADLFKNGCEISFTDAEDHLDGLWTLMSPEIQFNLNVAAIEAE